MSLLSTASRLNTANQLTSWDTQCKMAMSQAKSAYTSIATQRTAMVDNPDYTTEDIAEVDTILTELNLMAVSLTVSQVTEIPVVIPEPIVEVIPEVTPEIVLETITQ